ncbi:hypothetical protein NFI96_017072 [Prochilodus magdalenae]|nr:hypothetical protein NFI96_017072 [Prochilodus magdalenae]
MQEMSDALQYPEKEGTPMESESHVGEDHHSGDAVSCTDGKTNLESSPILEKSDCQSTSHTAVDELVSQEGKEGQEEEDDDKSAGESIQEVVIQQDSDDEQDVDPQVGLEQEAVEDNRKAENVEQQEHQLSQVEEEPGDTQSFDEDSRQEQAESKSRELDDENMAEKKRNNAQEDVEQLDVEAGNAGQEQGKQQVEDRNLKEKSVDEPERCLQDEKKKRLETDRDSKAEDTAEHQEKTEVEPKNIEEKNMDKKIVPKSSEGHDEPTEMDKKDKENSMEKSKHEMEQGEQEASETNKVMQKDKKHSESEKTEQEKLEEDEEPGAGNDGEEANEENWPLIRTIEDDSAETPMDIDHVEEKMQVDALKDSEPCLSKDNPGSPSDAVKPELKTPKSQAQTSKASSEDVASNISEKQTVQELKDEIMESSIQAPVSSFQPLEEEENMDLDSSSVLSVKVKDEPMDEEYDQALVLQDPAGKVKDEPDTTEECGQKSEDEFKISAVFSVGRNSAPTGSSTGSQAVSTSAKPSSTSSGLTPASSLCVVCSGCKKVLLKGQTAFQRKGSPQLFCSPQCLCSTATELMAKTASKKSCHYCLKEIPNPKDVISAPVDSARAMKDFCSQKCLSAFNYKRDSANSALPADHNGTKCSICQKACPTRHEVNYLGSVHKLCSDDCFNQFRASNKLTMNCCVHCGGYCYSGDGQCPSLVIDGSVKKLCSQDCVTAYKKKYGKHVPCTMCRGYHTVADMVESTNAEGNRELFCSAACVTAHKVQSVSSSGAAVECNNCKLIQVPQYHLAMSDSTIRNFCSFSCVVTFQDSFNKANSQNQLNVVSPSPSTTLTQSTSKSASTKPFSAEPSSSGSLQIPAVTKIPCAQCQRSFFRKPELLDFKGKMYAFCDKGCIDEFRRTNYIMAQCVYCKIDKVVKEIKRINNIDCSFCSEGCKLLYKHDLAKRWGKKHCRNCLYCNSTSQTLVLGLFSGKQEEFCGNECLSQYTLLFCQVAKCSTCKRAKKMVESVKWLGEMKHFCSLQCLMYFCSLQGNPATAVQTIKPAASQPAVAQPATTQSAVTQAVPISIGSVLQPTVPNTMATQTALATKEATPVIANVISLSNATNGQPSVLGSTALQGTVPACVKLIGHASTQTDAVRQHAAPPPRILKNKALLCKPMTLNKGTSCKPNTCDVNIQTDKALPEVVVLPLPVPVYVPVPMHLYTQYTPHGVGLPLPVPVPMFLPTTLDSAERIVETIQKIKEKIPENPIEADLIMMAEMVAEDSEKDKTASQGGEQSQEDNFIEDFDLEALSSNLSWEEDSVSSTSRWGRASESDKAPPPPSKQTPRSPTAPPTPATQQEPQMDLEADFPAESFELLEQRTQKDKTPTSRQRGRRRGRDGFPQKKRPRKRSGGSPLSPSGLTNVNKLHNEYGIQAWRSWIRWRNKQPNLETPKIGYGNLDGKDLELARNMTLKEDLLQCSTAELSYGLCKFISEARRPNGEMYRPDSIHYLCLGIQQYLFENGRMENIFADLFYTKFSQSITSILKDWTPTVLSSGYVHSRVEEEYLWECKQLGAFSPSVLLNTLLYFCTKFFNFKTVTQHRRLSFAHVMRCTRSHNNGKVACLRFYPPVPKESSSNADGVPAKRKRDDDEEDEGVVMEMQENAENPLRCPVRLYEFYLSKCSSSVKQRTNVFYLRPERSCVPNSPLWFSSMALDDEELGTMLTRILTVRELYLEREKPASVSDSDNASDSD